MEGKEEIKKETEIKPDAEESKQSGEQPEEKKMIQKVG